MELEDSLLYIAQNVSSNCYLVPRFSLGLNSETNVLFLRQDQQEQGLYTSATATFDHFWMNCRYL